ncbi:MAG: hypothetical protein U5J63_15720 [Fodinibius sp.]|nr:hypothetical protein [Fodinibius sp.]
MLWPLLLLFDVELNEQIIGTENILVTGANGGLGSHTIDFFTDKVSTDEIYGLVRNE